MRSFDAIVVGGGPAGSSCARVLVEGGLRVLLLDRARFPRLKPCAGWLSRRVWEVLAVAPRDYPYGLWEWNRCHVSYHGQECTVKASGYFVRRAEFDEFLLRRSGADVIEGHQVRSVERTDRCTWVVDGAYEGRFLVGAGGTHCPVARLLVNGRPAPPVGTLEHEFEADPRQVAACRAGEDGEPELLLYGDLSGYAWNVPKGSWLNVGCGTVRARDTRDAWQRSRAHFEDTGHIPASSRSMLDRMRGHAYYLYHPQHLASCHRDNALLIGDALGLAHPLTAEGILPAALSGRLAGQAIVSGDPERYASELAAHPVIRDCSLLHSVRALSAAVPARTKAIWWPGFVKRASRRAVATGFAWMFAGKPIAGTQILDCLVAALRRARGES